MKKILRSLGALCVLGLALLPSVVLGTSLLPAGSCWDVSSGGQHIGTVSVSGSGNMFHFNDDPTTTHPPDTSGSWALNSAGTGYENGAGHTVEFTDTGGGTYSWTKKDANGNVIDSGNCTRRDCPDPPEPK